MTDTIHLRDIDGDLDDLTPDQARRVPACDATDCAVLWVMGDRLARGDGGVLSWYTERSEISDYYDMGASFVAADYDGGTPTGVRPWQRVSRDPAAAYEARKWLRGRDSVHCVEVGAATETAYAMAFEPKMDTPIRLTYAPTEHLATARLILVLYAEGLL